jgi:two-component system, repressor protein LuxO
MPDICLLVLETEPGSLRTITQELEQDGCQCETALIEGGLSQVMTSQVPDVVLMDGADTTLRGLGDLGRLKAEFDELPIILVLAENPPPEDVVEAMRAGAFAVVPMDGETAKLLMAIQNAAKMHRLMIKVNQLQSRYTHRGKFGGIIGVSRAMQTIYSIIENVAATDVTVFIMGESGTGKELVAEAIHNESARSRRKFVAINCAAIPKDLLESELFGHEKGAFTGATSRYLGCCEQADGGTLFLDEICEMDINLQSKLLRFLQERTFHRLGGNDTRSVDVRIVAATNRRPMEQIDQGRLREDLYYRLNVVPIDLPPLRNRREDVPVLANTFLERAAEKYDRYFYDFAPESMGCLLDYGWPGNVREMENMIERIVVLHNGSRVLPRMLPKHVLQGSGPSTEEGVAASISTAAAGGAELVVPFAEVEKQTIIRALRICRGNVAMASEKLRIGQATLYRKIKKYEIDRRAMARVGISGG